MSAQANGAAARRPPRRGPMGGHGPGHGMMPGEKAKDFKGTLKKMIAFMGRFKAALVVVLVFAIGSTVFNIIGPKVLSTATTELFNGIVAKIDGSGGINFDAIAQILLFTLGLYLLSAACSFVQGWIMSSVSQRTSYQLRRSIAEKIDRMPMGYFERNSVGDTLSRITNDVDTLGQSLNQGVTQLITSVTTIVGVLVMMLTINPLMTLITVVILPVSVVLIMVVVKRSQKFFLAQQRTLGEINGLVEETFSGHAIVKAFNREDGTVDNFNETNARLYNSAWKSQFFSGLMQPIMNFVGNLGYVAVAITGSFLAVQGVITVGDIQAFIQYVKNFTQPITQLTQVSNVLQQMAAAAERIFEFLDEPEEEPDHATVTSGEVECEVEFDHVHFGYDPAKPVIEDFSARVTEGQTVALVGPTGAGKTTMVKLLMRFYDVQSGSIKIGGHDIRDFARDDLRSMFGMVLQDTWLFHGTIRDNIRYGKLDATDEEVEAAAKAAYVHHFIQTLPEGFDTEINEDASNISQGQRQLLTIARAILADRRMLILDEATSSVDTRTEERIQKAMDNLMAGRTSFVIAHRLSTIKNADLILVIRDGDIVEQGTHEELLQLGGFYAELYNSQFAETIDEIED
ncbi:ABC transporter ATP-binding protein [Gordonibacter urolithinfaciens]|uniref:Fatty acid ABC transporter ATP-binding/permease protein n=1 Tax=Gordonibacter urolithinfaciens TaxID=1335613 RepID=A0A6N8IGI6_9ACTN|nr:ABC transporter ATP-binding protein [Gordonibacter urolithinfaciens]MVM55471.1 ATP-binding cassette domain-containing protein [Gordonibacter urolithinfaciens]MVN14872.1 ATP-binding cassette domain-containing protein [Gordonibacter urolithinfaciens]MVN38849.1 ATP-binding cassette domain-containing protein [Gordonibacter urolithinfaciens]MVN56896.1 ATP-binding cassette domain-containing protein [Gordonibacter urolithinfaciens]MVN61641.1 ATP-binding cassette domain-containing protein [Gordonib